MTQYHNPRIRSEEERRKNKGHAASKIVETSNCLPKKKV